MKSSITQIKNSGGSFANRIDQVENKVRGIEDKIEELDQSDKDKEKY
jgi:Mg2+ and Co2+ transporter CorA